MIDGSAFKGLFSAIFFVGVLAAAVVVGLIYLFIWIFSSDDNEGEIRVKEPLKPTIEVITVDGVSDTTYIYKID
jgi:heme/copper-type cytochrome/quinol oxidase subunit 2